MNYDIWPKVSKGLSQPTDLFQSPHGDLVQESQPWTSVSRCPRCLSPRRCDAWWWFHFGDGTTQIFYSYTVCVYSMYMYILYYIYTDWWWLEPWNFEWLPFSWECHHPNWRSPSFFRGVGQPPIRYIYIYIYDHELTRWIPINIIWPLWEQHVIHVPSGSKQMFCPTHHVAWP